jgi:hypothetical protein
MGRSPIPASIAEADDSLSIFAVALAKKWGLGGEGASNAVSRVLETLRREHIDIPPNRMPRTRIIRRRLKRLVEAKKPLVRDAATATTLRVARRLLLPKQSSFFAAILIGFFAMLRVGEYTASSKVRAQGRVAIANIKEASWSPEEQEGWERHGILPGVDLLVRDVRVEGQTLRLRVHAGKTAKANATPITVAATKPPWEDICPVRAWTESIQARGKPDGLTPAFVSDDTAQWAMLRSSTLTAFLKKIGEAEGLRLSSHSLRSGGATFLHQQGVHYGTIKTLGRWTDDATLMRYIRLHPDEMAGIAGPRGLAGHEGPTRSAEWRSPGAGTRRKQTGVEDESREDEDEDDEDEEEEEEEDEVEDAAGRPRTKWDRGRSRTRKMSMGPTRGRNRTSAEATAGAQSAHREQGRGRPTAQDQQPRPRSHSAGRRGAARQTSISSASTTAALHQEASESSTAPAEPARPRREIRRPSRFN